MQAAALVLQNLLPQAEIDLVAMVDERSNLEDDIQPEFWGRMRFYFSSVLCHLDCRQLDHSLFIFTNLKCRNCKINAIYVYIYIYIYICIYIHICVYVSKAIAVSKRAAENVDVVKLSGVQFVTFFNIKKQKRDIYTHKLQVFVLFFWRLDMKTIRLALLWRQCQQLLCSK